MKRINIPDFQKKQHILYIDRKLAKDLITYGERYLEAGRISDTIDFYQRANHLSGLEKIREMTESTGDVMLFQQVMKALGRIISEEEWHRIGQKALSMQKYAFSAHAFEKSGNEAMRDKVREIIRTEGIERVS